MRVLIGKIRGIITVKVLIVAGVALSALSILFQKACLNPIADNAQQIVTQEQQTPARVVPGEDVADKLHASKQRLDQTTKSLEH